jgi:hypothetical protein
VHVETPSAIAAVLALSDLSACSVNSTMRRERTMTLLATIKEEVLGCWWSGSESHRIGWEDWFSLVHVASIPFKTIRKEPNY